MAATQDPQNKSTIAGQNVGEGRIQRQEGTGANVEVMSDVSGSTGKEGVSQEALEEAYKEDLRAGGAERVGGNFTMYTYDKMKKIERFSENAERSPAHKDRGAPSIFNTFSIFTHPGCDSLNKFRDRKEQEGDPRALWQPDDPNKIKNPKIEHLLEDFDPDYNKMMPYRATDFLYTKYFDRIPLNRLITLRRFTFPTFDNLFFPKGRQFEPIAQAVSYFGEPTENSLEELTQVEGFINWEELEAEVHDIEGNEQSAEDTPFLGGNSIVNNVAAAGGNESDISGQKQEAIERQKFNTFEYTNKVLGPVNVVSKTNVRKRGIGAELEFSINFNYELKSYNQINPRIAMIDLFCNMLALCFNNAKFWGGANRYFPNSPAHGMLGDEEKFYQGRYGDYIGSVVNQLSSGLGKAVDAIGGAISGILSGDFSGFGDLVKGAGGKLMDMQRRKSRPQVLGFHALLTGVPIGEWHLTIGNPYRPFMMIGNLICEGFEFNLGGHMGADDFPSDLNFTVNLKSGRPRDKGDLESIFSYGEGRRYYPPQGLVDVLNTSKSTGKNIEDDPFQPTRGGGGYLRPPKDQTTNATDPNKFGRTGVSADFVKKVSGSAF